MVVSNLPFRFVASETGRPDCPESQPAKSAMVSEPERRALPFIIIIVAPEPFGRTGNPSGPMLNFGRPSGAAGLALGSAGGAGGGSTHGFIFGPPFATTRSYEGTSFCSWWSTRWKRSASMVWNITLTCSLVAPAGTLATISYISDSIQLGPLIW